MNQRLYPPRELDMLVTIYVEGLPFAMCMAEKASLSAMQIRLSAWSVSPYSIDEVEFTRETPVGVERHRIPVKVDKVLENRARAVFREVPPKALTALRQLLYEEGDDARTPETQAGTA
ncbi:hypothetical protein [Thiohalorhabdus methylotrophus]|uniref:Uncharacterized protein n=1 Tax=Thiohalorhabdus methylotrophus TaxID=3242694 RepID=A0ABV4TV89_9GAMM